MSETKLIDIKELKFDEHNFNRHNDEGMSLIEKKHKRERLGAFHTAGQGQQHRRR